MSIWGSSDVSAVVNPVTGGIGISLAPLSQAVTVALGVLGQSNEAGATQSVDSYGNYTSSCVSAVSQGISEPVPLAPAGKGSMFTAACELLAKDGIRVHLGNGSLGGASIPAHFCGRVLMGLRANSTAYRGARTTLGTGDPGTKGDMMFYNNRWWECTTGTEHLAFLDSDSPVVFGSGTYYRNVDSVKVGTPVLSAASAPTFSATAAVGDTVVDGGLTWTCRSTTNPGAAVGDGYRPLFPTDPGYDPYGAIKRLADWLLARPVPDSKRFVYIQNAQSDQATNSSLYRSALWATARYFRERNIIPIFGLSLFYPSASAAGYDALETVLSGGGRTTAPNYASSPLTTYLTGAGWNMATPNGGTLPYYAFYYGASLWRELGPDVSGLLYGATEAAKIHTNLLGVDACAKALAPTLSKILRNSAT